MVQVDIFWSYGLSAGLALAGQKAIKAAPSWWQNSAFTIATLWTGLVFVPSGLYLLWGFPAWETMFVAENHLSIPAWLVTLFGLTNLTQGILGFYVTSYFLKAGNMRAAFWQPLWSHLAMLFVLVVGWDGAGYKRFFYAGSGGEWHSGLSYPISDFFSSSIFFTLLGLGVAFVPTYYFVIQKLRKL
jgi:hypothetical protein